VYAVSHFSTCQFKVRAMIEEGYFPFGYGGHGCIGKNLAQEAVLMMLAMIFSQFEVRDRDRVSGMLTMNCSLQF